MGREQPIAETEGPIRHKLTVDEFLILDDAGVFGDDHVELIDGEIFVLSPVHFPHAHCHAEFIFAVMSAVKKLETDLVCCMPVSALFDDHNLPEADLLLVRSIHEKFVSPGAIGLAVEISASTLRYDLIKKGALYALGGVPEYWVVDVNGRRIVRLCDPRDGAYATRDEFAFGQPVTSATIDGLVIDTTALP